MASLRWWPKLIWQHNNYLLILKLKPQGNVTSADVSSSQSTCNPSLALVNNPLWFTRLSAGTRLIYFIAFSNAAMVIDRHQQSIESSARGSFEHLVNLADRALYKAKAGARNRLEFT